jgi:hypothetical protein
LRDKINSLRLRCNATENNLFGAMNLKIRAETEKIQELLKIAADV